MNSVEGREVVAGAYEPPQREGAVN